MAMPVVTVPITRSQRKNACIATMVFITAILKRKERVMDKQAIYDKVYDLSGKRGVQKLPRIEQIEMYITLFEELTKEEKCSP